MNRIEKVRAAVDEILLNMTDCEERRCAYIHLYGVAQSCALLALKRHENVELAVVAGVLHDIYSYANMDSHDHAHKGAAMARDILKSLNLFAESEENMICAAIYNHSNKSAIHTPLDEILKDADVMQHVLYNPFFEIKPSEGQRFHALKKEFDIEN